MLKKHLVLFIGIGTFGTMYGNGPGDVTLEETRGMSPNKLTELTNYQPDRPPSPRSTQSKEIERLKADLLSLLEAISTEQEPSLDTSSYDLSTTILLNRIIIRLTQIVCNETSRPGSPRPGTPRERPLSPLKEFTKESSQSTPKKSHSINEHYSTRILQLLTSPSEQPTESIFHAKTLVEQLMFTLKREYSFTNNHFEQLLFTLLEKTNAPLEVVNELYTALQIK